MCTDVYVNAYVCTCVLYVFLCVRVCVFMWCVYVHSLVTSVSDEYSVFSHSTAGDITEQWNAMCSAGFSVGF